jgi:hypothetical protein
MLSICFTTELPACCDIQKNPIKMIRLAFCPGSTWQEGMKSPLTVFSSSYSFVQKASNCLLLIVSPNSWPDLQREVVINAALTMCQT